MPRILPNDETMILGMRHKGVQAWATAELAEGAVNMERADFIALYLEPAVAACLNLIALHLEPIPPAELPEAA
jgi:hypothetical protein